MIPSIIKLERRILPYSIAVFLLFGLGACSKEEAADKVVVRPVRAMVVTEFKQPRQRQFPGQAEAIQEINLSFRVSGPLITLPVVVGDKVNKGDVVARIDPRDYEVQISNVQGQLDRARAKVQRAESEYERETRVLKQDPGATSQVAIDRKKADRDQSRAGVNSLIASLTAVKDSLSDTYLRAPFDGIVVNTYVKNFEAVQVKEPIVRIIDKSRIKMVINIPEGMISLVPKATDIEVVFDAFPGKIIPAEITEVGAEASSTTRTYPITLIMDQPDDIKILPGMAGRASGRPRDAIGIQVPLTAILSTTQIDKTYVWIIDENTSQVSKREVTIASLTDTGITIENGLQAGELIAIAGVHYLSEGMEVLILEERAE